ncbi:class I SAM-dependent DNA methyltransferase [Brachybacterium sacelli]|uniref:site-specific DNA-methyltransferase (adenine-specific) n=1 Tax=Brachybacterium sacelli TaxID=173364 RepID=A0ABS4X5S0_9MICO|nr:class I SAM-dependent DNA methyltransferase [Brachybacterium sacelli]MBP2383733.1 hypothetical protein [Brachybacterium sacelli]
MKQKPLVLSDIRSRAGTFVADWRDAEGYERGEAQSFVRDLLQVFGITRTTAAVYEQRAKRASTGQRGYIDALISGTALIEMKSAGEDLIRAEQQALDYMESLTDNERPDHIITSDFRRFRLLDLTAERDDPATIEFALEQLPAHVEDLMFLAGYRRAKFGSSEQESASIRAAQLMAKLWEHLEATGYDDHQASIFLIRTLFCLYADDSGLWERDLFSRYIEERTSEDGSDLGAQLTTLYQALNRPEDKRYGRADDLIMAFPYVNGSVFGEAVDIPYFDRAARETLLQAAYFNWSSISPAIFGSLFQAVKDKKARRELGEHYTTETNILKVIRPLFLDELEERFEKSRAKKRELEKLLQHLGTLRFFDPACGCGNFLIIAYRELRALELRIHERLQELDPKRAQLSLDAESRVHVKLSQFHGIELEEWPATIARTAMFLVEHQANQAVNLTLGYAVPMLPLQDSAQIVVANALRTSWADVLPPSPDVYLMGNPPFVGHKERTSSQGDDLRIACQTHKVGHRDYVTGWLSKAADYFAASPGAGQFAFVATNSITQGESVGMVFDPLFRADWRIAFAHKTFAWTSESPKAAAVHCVIVGFSKGSRKGATLFEYASPKGAPVPRYVSQLNGYLFDGPLISITPRRQTLSGALPAINAGSTAIDWDGLQVTEDALDEVSMDPAASRYLRPYLGGDEVINGIDRWCLWMDHLEPIDVRNSSILRSRLEFVRLKRNESSRAATNKLAASPHLFGEMRQPLEPYLAVPQTFAEARLFVTSTFLPETTIASMKLFTLVDDQEFAFGLISSSMFIVWLKTVGGRLKSDPSLSSSIVWNNLPLPDTSEKLRDQIIAGGQSVLGARALHPERSLAQHYAPLAMDPALLKAHRTLDTAVDRAFGARRTCTSEQERQRILFERYAELTADE